MSTIAIVGAGPGLGLSIARTFAAQGFDIALISRNQDNLDTLTAQLQATGATATGFTADVLDRTSLTRAVQAAAERFGGIDVLEYSPVGGFSGTRLTIPSESTPEALQEQVEFQLYGAVAATAAVLPAMRVAGEGTLLFTTGAGSITPVPFVGNVNAAAAALRNWAINLNTELSGTGIFAAHVGIDVSINGVAPDFPAMSADQVAVAYWELYQTRDVAEKVITA